MNAAHQGRTILSTGILLIGVIGCASEQPARPGVPSNAALVSSGNKVVSFTATQDGKAYLNDDTDHRVAYSTQLKAGQVMRFDPETSAVQIDGKTAPEGIPDPGHDHSIYFIPAEKAVAADAPARADSSPTTVPTVRVPIGVKVDVQQPQDTPPQPQQ